jgi:hypothetical protein
MFVNVLDRLSPADWERTVRYSYPEPTWRSLRWVARHTAHEVRHHLLDIRRQLPVPVVDHRGSVAPGAAGG